jgi:hypothetical protein
VEKVVNAEVSRPVRCKDDTQPPRLTQLNTLTAATVIAMITPGTKYS